MAYITDHLDLGGHSFKDGVVSQLSKLRLRFLSWREARTIEHELGQYSATELAELGIRSSDISAVARDASRLLSEPLRGASIVAGIRRA